MFLFDGSSLLSTSFFGTVPASYYKTGDPSGLMRTSKGLYTNGVYTMTKILMNFLDLKPTHIAVAWDVSRNTFRREAYAEYKGNRKDTKPELGEQFQTMQEVLDAMGVAQFKLAGYEADDLLGTLAKRFEDEVTVVVITKDQDALQLVSEGTRVWLNTSKAKEYKQRLGIDEAERTLKKSLGENVNLYPVPDGFFEFTPLTFEEIYELKPAQMVDKKALEGDKSDNIPGVKGVGEGAAVKLLQEFGTVEAIYEAIEGTGEAEMKELLKALGISRSPVPHLLKESDEELVGKKAALLSKSLATIKTDIEELSGASAADLETRIDWAKAKEKFRELEFKSFLEKK